MEVMIMRLIDADALHEDITNGDGTSLQKFFADCCVAAAPTINPYKWISVEDRLPSKDCIPANFLVVAKVGDEIVVDLAERYPYKNCLTGEEGAELEIFHDWDEGQGCEITHWMPLPAPPTEKED
jgi:hypothetical protein